MNRWNHAGRGKDASEGVQASLRRHVRRSRGCILTRDRGVSKGTGSASSTIMKCAVLLVALILPAHAKISNLVLTNDDGWAVANIRAQNDALRAAGYDVGAALIREFLTSVNMTSRNSSNWVSNLMIGVNSMYERHRLRFRVVCGTEPRVTCICR